MTAGGTGTAGGSAEGVLVDGTRLLVTGAAGRVAGQLLPGLADRHELRLTDRGADTAHSAGPELVVGELTDRDLLDDLLEGVDAVVHLAGNPDPSASWGQLREPNVEAFTALLTAARSHGVRRVVFASSVHAMGAYEGLGRWPVDAAWPPAPCCAYGATKAFDEALARVYSYRSPLSLIGLRLGLCTPSPSDAEAAAGWTSPADLQQLVVRALETDLPFGVYHAMSWPSRRRWKLDATMTELGYEPDREGQRADLADGVGAGHLSTCGSDAEAEVPADPAKADGPAR
jgi:NAD+ dependent glucose-6-phosphate dehydrogenase